MKIWSYTVFISLPEFVCGRRQHQGYNVGKVSNFGAVGDGSIKGNVGKFGKVSNFGAVGDGSNKGNAGKVGKVSNFGAVGMAATSVMLVKLVK